MPRTERSRYGQLLAEPGAIATTTASIVARLPAAMSNLVLVTAVATATGSFGSAGWAAGAFVAGIAVSGPFRGRFVDRHGASSLLLVTGALTAASWVALYLVLEAGAPFATLLACCLVAGATTPPVTPVMRTMWSRAVPDPALKVAATSWESVVVEVSYVAGPALAAGALLVVGGVPSALVVAVLNGVGCGWLAASRPVRSLRGRAPAERDLVGPLRRRAVRRMLVVGLFGGAGIGAVEVAVLARTDALGRPSLGGLVIGSLSVGCVVGGLGYGSRSTAQHDLRRLRLLLATVGVGFGVSAVSTDVRVLFTVVVVTGVAFAPMTSELYAAFELASPPQFLAETFTWQASAVQTGTAATVALAGALAEAGHPGGGFVVAMATCALAAALVSIVPLDAPSQAPAAPPQRTTGPATDTHERSEA